MHHARLLLLCLALAGCAAAPPPHLFVPAVGDSGLTAILAAHPLPAGGNISALPLQSTEAASYHLIQVRDHELPHVHATHDLAVTVLRGTGRLFIRGEPHDMRPGDVAVVPRATPHYFVNSGAEPAVAFVTFAPPYDGTDQVPTQ